MNLLSNAVKYTNEGSIDFNVSASIVEDKAMLKKDESDVVEFIANSVKN